MSVWKPEKTITTRTTSFIAVLESVIRQIMVETPHITSWK